jgi:hypothetical protein
MGMIDPYLLKRELRKPRASLSERAAAVFGKEEGAATLRKLENRHSADHHSTKGFDRWARSILRTCESFKGPEEIRMRRRRAYINACCRKKFISDTHPVTEWEQEEQEGEDWFRRTRNPAKEIAKKLNVKEAEVSLRASDLYLAVSWRYRGDDNEAQSARVREILWKAYEKNSPLRYLRRIVENEKAERKERQAQKAARTQRRRIDGDAR